MSSFVLTTYVYGDAFWNFYNAQTKQVQDKIDWIIEIVRTVRMVPEKFLKRLEAPTDYMKSG